MSEKAGQSQLFPSIDGLVSFLTPPSAPKYPLARHLQEGAECISRLPVKVANVLFLIISNTHFSINTIDACSFCTSG